MKLIIVNTDHSGSKQLSISPWTLAFLVVCLLSIPLAVGYYAAKLIPSPNATVVERSESSEVLALKEQVESDQKALQAAKFKATKQLEVLTIKMAELQARLLRLDALGGEMAAVANIDAAEFDFSSPPAVGGPLVDDVLIPTASIADTNKAAEPKADANVELIAELDNLAERIELRSQQLGLLKDVLANRKSYDAKRISGRPILSGWTSSVYGQRKDPFTGKQAMHKGIDFAGKEGASIIAVGSGVVTWSGKMHGYGNMVEINHGSGMITRYAHNKENLVKVGDLVEKDQAIAKMGNSGRSTGPHVHFEVYKHGRAVDPSSYIRRTRR